MTSLIEPSGPQPKLMTWVGWGLTILMGGFMLVDAAMKILRPAQVVEMMTKLGYSEAVLIPLGVTLLISAILYLIPPTSVLGAILLTGYLGGAVDVHVREGDGLGSILFPAGFGAVIWLGLYFRDARIRDLFPVRAWRY